MSSLTEQQAALASKITGINPSTGLVDNYLDVNADGSTDVVIQDQSGNHVSTTTVTGHQALDVNVVQDVITALSYRNITGNQTVTVKSGAGVLGSILVGNNNTGGQYVLYDSLTATGTVIATIILGSPTGGLLSVTGLQPPTNLGPLNLAFNTGLTIVTSGSTNNNVTLIYK